MSFDKVRKPTRRRVNTWPLMLCSMHAGVSEIVLKTHKKHHNKETAPWFTKVEHFEIV